MGFCFLESLSLVGSDSGNRKGIRHLRTHSSKGHVGGSWDNWFLPQDSRSAMRSVWFACMCVYLCTWVRKNSDRASCAWQSKHFAVIISQSARSIVTECL